jgi:peptidoglycan/LPS O-acetylase OafA/YrhL
MAHCCSGFLVGANEHYREQPLYAFADRGQLGVMLFFVISGYCITAAAMNALLSGKSVRRYAFERVRRIYPPYLAALVLGTLSIAVIVFANARHWIPPVHHLATLPTSPRYWVANLFLLQYEMGTGFADDAFWSLCYEIAFYSIVGALLWLAKAVAARRGMGAGTKTLAAGLVLSTAATLATLIAFNGAVFPLDQWHQFSLGGVLFLVLEARPNTVPGFSNATRRALLAGAGLLVLLTVAYIALREVGEVTFAHPSSRVRSALCLAFCLLLAGLRRVDLNLAAKGWMRPLLWLGACSYSLYLIHPIVLPYVDILTRRAGLDGDLYWVSFWIQFVVAIAAGRAFYRLTEVHFVSQRQKQRLREEHVG